MLPWCQEIDADGATRTSLSLAKVIDIVNTHGIPMALPIASATLCAIHRRVTTFMRRAYCEGPLAWISTRRSFAKTVAKGRRISADLWTQRPDQERTSDQQKSVYATRVKCSLRTNRVLWKAESPDAGCRQGQNQRPKIPAAPDDARNGQQQQHGPHRLNCAGVSHPIVRRARCSKVTKSGYEQKARQDGNVDCSRHAVTGSSIC